MIFLGCRNRNSATVGGNRHPKQFLPENSNTVQTYLVRILHLHYKTAFFPGKTRVRGRLWRLTGRLTETLLGSKAAHKTTQHLQAWTCMDRHRKPKQLARNAKNHGKTRVFERRGQEPNNLQIPWETSNTTPRATRNPTRAHCEDSHLT